MSDGILEQARMSALFIIGSVASRTYGETVSDAQNLQVDGNTRDLSGSDGVVLVEEVSGTG